MKLFLMMNIKLLRKMSRRLENRNKIWIRLIFLMKKILIKNKIIMMNRKLETKNIT